MTDNTRFALYGSQYTLMLANKAMETANYNCSVVGRCCESGDIIQENVTLPDSVQKGDVLAVFTTGAYNYSMSSNYNRFLKPPVVMLRNGIAEIVVRRETLEDITRYDV